MSIKVTFLSSIYLNYTSTFLSYPFSIYICSKISCNNTPFSPIFSLFKIDLINVVFPEPIEPRTSIARIFNLSNLFLFSFANALFLSNKSFSNSISNISLPGQIIFISSSNKLNDPELFNYETSEKLFKNSFINGEVG